MISSEQAQADMQAAAGALTRWQMPTDNGTWAWPVTGALIGLALAVTAEIALCLGLSPQITALILLGLHALITGGMHEKAIGGLAQDHTLGIFTLLLVTIARWSALTVIVVAAPWALIGIGALSRLPMIAFRPAPLIVAFGLALVFVGWAALPMAVIIVLATLATQIATDAPKAGQQMAEVLCLAIIVAWL